MKNFDKYNFLKRFMLVFIDLAICNNSSFKAAIAQLYKELENNIAIDAEHIRLARNI